MADENKIGEKTEMLIFQDIFRRANKKDDGAISWEEFVSYFDDGITGMDNLRTLFNDIDTHNTNNIDTGEMCSYFYKHLGSLEKVFQKLDEMNSLVSASLTNMAEDYQEKSWKDKFVGRFLLREISTQLSALERPIEAAADSFEDPVRLDTLSNKITDSCVRPQFFRSVSGVVPGRFARRARNQMSDLNRPTSSDEVNRLATQVDALGSLIQRLETKVNLQSVVDMRSSQSVSIARTECIIPKDMDRWNLLLILLKYNSEANNFEGCLKSDIRLGEDSAVIHGVWRSEKCRFRFNETDSCSEFTNDCRDLGILLDTTTMSVPDLCRPPTHISYSGVSAVRSREAPYVCVSQEETRLVQPVKPNMVQNHVDLLPAVKRNLKKNIDLKRARSIDSTQRDILATKCVTLSENMQANRNCVPPLKKKYMSLDFEKRANMVSLRPRLYREDVADWQRAHAYDRWLGRGSLRGPADYVHPPRDDMHEELAKQEELKEKCIKEWLNKDKLQRTYVRPLKHYGGHLPLSATIDMFKAPQLERMKTMYIQSYKGQPNSAFPKERHNRCSWFKRDKLI